jgi:hypothetical protein
MDIKKFKPKDLLPIIEGLLEKIPDHVADLIKKFFIFIFAIAILYAMYSGYQDGFASAKEEGQELAKDTKTLFLEEIERSYNRKRVGIRMNSFSETPNFPSDENRTEKKYISNRRDFPDNNNILESDQKLAEREGVFQEMKKKGDTPPLDEIQDGTGYLNKDTELETVVPKKSYRPSKDQFLIEELNNSEENFYANTIQYKQETTQRQNTQPIESEKRLMIDTEDSQIFRDSSNSKIRKKLLTPKKSREKSIE